MKPFVQAPAAFVRAPVAPPPAQPTPAARVTEPVAHHTNGNGKNGHGPTGDSPRRAEKNGNGTHEHAHHAAAAGAAFDPFWLGAELVTRKVITPEQLLGAQEAHKAKPGQPFVDTLLLLGLVSPAAAAEMIAKRYSLHAIDLAVVGVDPKVARELPIPRARRVAAIPFRRDNGKLHIAVADPQIYPPAIAAGDLKTDSLVYYVAPKRNILALIDELSHDEAPAANASELLKNIAAKAVKKRASDIHLEPKENNLEVRYRIDGEMVHEAFIDNDTKPLLVNAAMIAATINPSEGNRLPGDGQATMEIGAKVYTFRVATAPVKYGTMATLRVLDEESHARTYAEQGLPPELQQLLTKLLGTPNGIILATGPTGSGKTTFIHCTLDHVHSPTLKIITIENPIEYTNPRYCQMEINPAIGFDFAKALHCVVRHDPDIIFIGELRDIETAQVAVRAALTGHLVFGTLHTNSAVGAINRLKDIGIPAFLIATAVRAVCGQRLVRKLCTCSVPHPHLQQLRTQFNLPDADFRAPNPEGCPECRRTGYSRRVGIFEIFPIRFDHSEEIRHLQAELDSALAVIDEQLASLAGKPASAELDAQRRQLHEARSNHVAHYSAKIDEQRKLEDEVVDLIQSNATESAIAGVYRRRGFRTMRDDGIAKAAAGTTSLEEVFMTLG